MTMKIKKLNMSKLKLKWKIFGFLLSFCALLLVILWLFQTVFLSSFYREIKVMEIKSDASTVQENINNKNLSHLITRISQSSDESIEVMTLDGMVLYTSDTIGNSQDHKGPVINKMDLILHAESHNNVYLEYTLYHAASSADLKDDFVGMPRDNDRPEQALSYVRIVKTASGEPVAIVMSSMISPVNATITTLKYQLWVITGIMVILAILLSLIIARRVSKPIEEINKSAKILANGDYDTHFAGKGFREIVELSDTLNTAANELSKVESLRRELMANVSHDLRTPLSLIYSYAEMMHDFPDEITPEQTQTIMDEAQRLSTLVNDVLDISKFETGIQALNTTEFNLTQSLKATIERIRELTKKDGYDVMFVYNKEINVTADEVKITQAFYNLLINAINYTGKNKRISIKQVVGNKSVIIEVTDTGEGISPENLLYIWDRYYKVDKKHKRAITGTGLGLSIVKKIIELHRGQCGVKSQVGKGSTFWFSLKI
jgi:signal transduction histidine kinase